MKIKLIILTVFILNGILLNAQENSEQALFNEANTHYKNNEFDDAEKLYLQILNSGYSAPGLYYNLGNTCYRLQKFTDAIYYYEKAAVLAPSDDDIEHNLAYARLSIREKLEEVPEFFMTDLYKKTTNLSSADIWAKYSLIAFLLTIAAALMYLFAKTRRIKILGFVFSLLFLVASISTYVFSGTRLKIETGKTQAIVYTESVPLRSSPDETATVLIRISAGHKVKIQEHSGDWAEIKLSNGQVGWVLDSDLKLL